MVKVFLAFIVILIGMSTQQEDSLNFLSDISRKDLVDCVAQTNKATCLLLNCFWDDVHACRFKKDVLCTDATDITCSLLPQCYWDFNKAICRSMDDVVCTEHFNYATCNRFSDCYWDNEKTKCRFKADVSCSELDCISCARFEKCYINTSLKKCLDRSTLKCETLNSVDCLRLPECHWNFLNWKCEVKAS